MFLEKEYAVDMEPIYMCKECFANEARREREAASRTDEYPYVVIPLKKLKPLDMRRLIYGGS